MSLMAGDAGVSGISGSSVSSSSVSWVGGAPKAAAGGGAVLLNAVGLTTGHEWQECRSYEEMIGGGLSGRGAAAGVVGGDTAKVLTITLDSDDPEGPATFKLDTVWLVMVWLGVQAPLSLVEKSSRYAMASISISSSPSSSNFCRTLLRKGETEWGRMDPLLPDEEDKEPPYPSSTGGAEGSTGLAITKKKNTHYKSHFTFLKNKKITK